MTPDSLQRMECIQQRDTVTIQRYGVKRWVARAVGCGTFGEGDTLEEAVERALTAAGVAQAAAETCDDLF